MNSFTATLTGGTLRPRLGRGLALAGVALLVAGCGLSGGSSSGTSNNATTSQGVTGKSIKIGILGPFSGSASLFSKTEDMEIAIYKDANAHGGVNGRQLDLVVGDSACDATTEQVLIRKFVDQDQVFMIHGGSCSDAVVAAKPLIDSSGVPFLTANAASGAISNPPLRNLFQPKPTADESSASIVKFIQSNPNIKTVGIVAEPTSWGQSELQPLMKALQGTDLKVVVNEQIDRGAGDATPQVTKLRQANPDVVVVFAYPQPLAVFLRDARTAGLKGPFLTGDQVRPSQEVSLVKSADLISNLLTASMMPKPADAPEYQQYRDLWQKYYPNLSFDSQAQEGVISATYNLELLKSLGNNLTWDNWIKAAETKTFPVPMVGNIRFKPFNASDPSTRRPGLEDHFA
ncbi:MAG TPA: ABC transporter substrate-binding protein, partial [Candidatus Saccharimonadales bacterium]|nr:ABC transporter substrate-binding protein [Candidatus Saccharimonadales bacterium]